MTQFLSITVVFLSIIVTVAQADEPSSAARLANTEKAEIKIFMRVSKELFEELTQDVVQMTMPVRECVEGIPLRGQATGEGYTSVQLETSGENADFLVSVSGTAVASTRADVGPAIARMTSRAQFTTRKRFRFDGITFRSSPASTATRNRTSIDRICAKTKGPVGRLIEHVGRRMADNAKPEINSVAEEFTEDMLSQTFDDIATELIGELNQITKFEETVDKYFPETKSWKYRFATRPNALLVGVGPPDASFPEFLGSATEQPEALMEMWLPLTPGQAAILEVVGDLDIAHDLLSEFLSEEEAKEIAEDVKLVRRGEWSVIQMGLPKVQTQAKQGL